MSEHLPRAARDEHAIKLNLLRRQMDDEAWTDAFERLAAIRQVRLGSGGDHKSNGRDDRLNVTDLASELGVSKRTAERKRKNAATIPRRSVRLGNSAPLLNEPEQLREAWEEVVELHDNPGDGNVGELLPTRRLMLRDAEIP